MALSANLTWEVQTSGADTNGGAYLAGAGTTDYSQISPANVAVTDLVTTSGSATVTSISGLFTAQHVGNVAYIAGGTGTITAQRYQIITFNSATSIVLDRSTGIATGINATCNIGGPVLTFGELASTRGMVGSNAAFVKAGAGYTQTATPTFAVGAASTTSLPYSRLIGYTTTRGDGGRVNITLSTTSALVGIKMTADSWYIANFNINCSSLITSTGITVTANAIIQNCKISNATSAAITATTDSYITNCEITGCTSAATTAITATQRLRVEGSWIHDNACTAITSTSTGLQVHRCLITNNTGATSDGIVPVTPQGISILNNTIYGCGRHGIFNNSTTTVVGEIRGNIIAKSGATAGTAYGLNMGSAAGAAALPSYDGNAYWSNKTADRNNADDTTTNPVSGVTPYVNVFDVTVSVDPFVNAAGNDFTLNTTATGGALCRAAGVPRAWPGITQTGFPDMGAIQCQAVKIRGMNTLGA